MISKFRNETMNETEFIVLSESDLLSTTKVTEISKLLTSY